MTMSISVPDKKKAEEEVTERTASISFLDMDSSLEDFVPHNNSKTNLEFDIDCSQYFEDLEKEDKFEKEEEVLDDLAQEMKGFQRRRNAQSRREKSKFKEPRKPRKTRRIRPRTAYYNQSESESEGELPVNPSARRRNSDCPECPESRFFQDLLADGTLESNLESKTWQGYFRGVTPERVAVYIPRAAKAVKKDDLSKLQKLCQNDPSILDGCNDHGESILHLACRLGRTEMVQFLLEQAPLSAARVQDQVGRTLLHEAAWTNKPQFDLILALILKAPELLVVVDDRGFTALNYIPKTCWDEWNEFLGQHRHVIQPRLNHPMDCGVSEKAPLNSAPQGVSDLLKPQDPAPEGMQDLLKSRDQLNAAQERMQDLMRRMNASALLETF